MSTLSEIVKVRVDPETKAELEKEADRRTRKPGELARRYIREGLARDQAERGESLRV